MKLSGSKLNRVSHAVLCAAVLLVGAPAGVSSTTSGGSDDLLSRTRQQVATFVEQFSDVKCTEHVKQEKINPNGKIQLREESIYDYLLILTNAGGELNLNESRLAVHEAKADKKNTPMLVTNGFATLSLIFHPLYANSFLFSDPADTEVDGQKLSRVDFKHVPGTRSPAALALRGREYPLELTGSAWIDPQTGVITKMIVGVGSTMEDVGLKTLRSEIDYAPISFHNVKDPSWFPVVAKVEVETPRQHWRNTHQFTDYKRFSVSTEEQVGNK
jgi:hypothetical protein